MFENEEQTFRFFLPRKSFVSALASVALCCSILAQAPISPEWVGNIHAQSGKVCATLNFDSSGNFAAFERRIGEAKPIYCIDNQVLAYFAIASKNRVFSNSKSNFTRYPHIPLFLLFQSFLN